MKLYDHQLEAITYANLNRKTLLALDQGLGKTLVSLMTIMDHERVLVITPATLKLTWAKEIEKFCPHLTYQIVKGTKAKIDTEKQVTIINYDILGKRKVKPKREIVYNYNLLDYDKIIIDESHFIKNINSIRSIICAKICINTPRVLLLSGTPMEKPKHLYVQMRCLNLTSMPYRDFTKRFCNGHFEMKFGKRIWNDDGRSNTEELRDLLAPKMLRMKKEDVIDLPEKIIQVIDLDLPLSVQDKNFGEINITEDTLPEYFENMATYLRQEGLRKVNHALTHIKMRLENNEKIFVVAKHTDVIDCLMDELEEFHPLKLDGRDSAEDKQMSVELFQKVDHHRVFIGQINAAGVGITLTAANHVIICESTWSYSDLMQVIDRCHRIGQKNTVTCEILTVAKSLDSIMLNHVLNKKETVERIIENVE